MSHPARAAAFTANAARMHWHDQALWTVRTKRDRAAGSVGGEWEQLRALAAAIKAHTLARLPDYLEQFERNAVAHGAHVHWARDAAAHNRIVHDLLASRGVRRVVKSKSMLTEECGLNPHLEARGIQIVDTDLGERIVQLRHEPPSHIVLPAIHLKRDEIGDLFHEQLGSPAGLSDPKQLTEVARQHLRPLFFNAQAAITGVNFAVAETGGVVVCTNEGNADLGTSLAPLHIACMGIEKVIPRAGDLGVFLRLLARSATGQAITTYTSHFHGPKPGGELHIVIVDNGRSALRGRPAFSSALACIRCGACMNTCPVYRRSGGHSYGATIPGPIGSILEPARDPARHRTLPFACSMCGSCTDVCPVKIPLHHQLLAWRRELVTAGLVSWTKRAVLRMARVILSRPWLLRLVTFVPRRLGPALTRRLLARVMPSWAKQRDIPALAPASFRRLYRKRRRP